MMSGQAMREAGSKKGSAKCYNCGAEDHFMMACPEPTRQVPAGLAAARAAQTGHPTQPPEVAANTQQSGWDQRPHKRPKTVPLVTKFPPPRNGPIVTRYAPPLQTQQSPPHANQGSYNGPSQQYPQQYSSVIPFNQPYSQEISPQPNMPYAQYGAQSPINMPQVYGPSQPYGQFSASVYPQDYGQPSPSLALHHQGQAPQLPALHRYGYQSPQSAEYQYGGYPTSSQPYGYEAPPQYSLQQMSGQPLQQQYQPYQQSPSAHFQELIQQWGQPPVNRMPHVGPALQPNRSAYQPRYHSQQGQKPRYHQGRPTRPPFQNSSPGLRTNASNFHQNLTSLSNEDQEFEWDLEKIFVEIIHSEADPVAQPLSAVFSDEPLLPPLHNSTLITSKYVRPINLEVFCRDIRKTLHWPRLKPDPVFKEIDYKSNLIPLDRVGEWMQNRSHRNKIADVMKLGQQTPSRKRAWSDERIDTGKHANQGSFSDFPSEKHQPSLDMHRTPPGNPFTANFDGSSTPVYARSGTPSLGAEDDVWAPQPGEGLVTSSTENPTEARLASLGVTGSPKPLLKKPQSLYSGPLAGHEEDPNPYSRKLDRQDSGYVSARGSYSNPSASGLDNFSGRYDRRQSYSANNPPPPPPAHLRRQLDGTLDSPPSDVLGPGYAAPRGFHNGRHQANSPLTPTSTDAFANETKILYERKNGRKVETHRQIDDVTPRIKTSQPKVAEAYSRRW